MSNVKPVEERLEDLRKQHEEWLIKTLDEVQNKRDEFPRNVHLIVQYSNAVCQFATSIDRAEKQRKGIPI